MPVLLSEFLGKCLPDADVSLAIASSEGMAAAAYSSRAGQTREPNEISVNTRGERVVSEETNGEKGIIFTPFLFPSED
jgi:hypothetical protein